MSFASSLYDKYTTQVMLHEILENANNFKKYILDIVDHPNLHHATITPIRVDKNHKIELSIIGSHAPDVEPCNEQCKIDNYK